MLRFLAFGDVSDGCGHQDSFRTFQWAQHDLDRKLTSMLPPPFELNPRPDLLRHRLRRGSRTVRDEPFRKALWNDVLHLLPNQFIAPVSKLLLRLNVQQHYVSALVNYHHRIRSRLQQSPVPALHLRQMLFRSLAHADVPDCRRDQNSFRAFQWAQHDLDRKIASILPPPI